MLKGSKHKPETISKQRQKAREIAANRRRLAAVGPADVVRLVRKGEIAPSLRAYARQATETTAALVEAQGGEDRMSAQRMVITQDIGRMDLLLRAGMAALLQTGTLDLDLLSRVTALVNSRRQSLTTLGLDFQAEADALDVRSLAAAHAEAAARERQAQQESANGSGPDPDTREDENAPEIALQGPTSAPSGDTSVGNGEVDE